MEAGAGWGVDGMRKYGWWVVLAAGVLALLVVPAGAAASVALERVIEVPPEPPGGTLPLTGVRHISAGWTLWLLLGAGALARRIWGPRRP